MLKKLICFCGVLTVSVPCFAISENDFILQDDWHFLINATNGKAYLKGVRGSGDVLRFWVKYETDPIDECNKNNAFMSSPMEDVTCGIKSESETGSFVADYSINCKSHKIKHFSSVEYNYKNHVLNSSDKVGGWKSITSGTIFETVAKKLCY